MNTAVRIMLVFGVVCALQQGCDGQGIMAKAYFRYFEKVTMWGRTVFRSKHSVVEDCALKCLNMNGKCKAFVFSRITGNCYGLPYDIAGGIKHVRKSNHYDLYCTIARKVEPYWRQSRGSRAKITVDIPPVQYTEKTTTTERTTTTTTTTTTPTTTTTTTEAAETTECTKEAPMILYMASSYYWQYTPDNAEPSSGTGWLANKNNYDQYLEMDVRELKEIASITTYGATYLFRSQYVTAYKIQFLYKPMGEYLTYQENGADKVFEGNTDSTSPVTHHFARGEITAIKIRIVPVDYHNNIMLRATANVYC